MIAYEWCGKGQKSQLLNDHNGNNVAVLLGRELPRKTRRSGRGYTQSLMAFPFTSLHFTSVLFIPKWISLFQTVTRIGAGLVICISSEAWRRWYDRALVEIGPISSMCAQRRF
jgi:hypothetical protein